jgi:hypothetical protein
MDTEGTEWLIRRLHRLRRFRLRPGAAGELTGGWLWVTFSFAWSLNQTQRENLRNLRIIHLCVLCVSVVK